MTNSYAFLLFKYRSVVSFACAQRPAVADAGSEVSERRHPLQPN